jgi:hypothetical protein
LQPTSEPGVQELAKESEVQCEVALVVGPSLTEQVNTPARDLDTRPLDGHHSKPQSEESRAPTDRRQSGSTTNDLSAERTLKQNTSQASTKSLGFTRYPKSADPVDVYNSAAMQASKAAQQSPNSRKTIVEPEAKPTSYLSLPLEIRQQILSYLIDPEELSREHFILTLANRPATTLSQVSHQVRIDTHYLYLQWRRRHNIQDALCLLWTGEDQKEFDELKEMIGYQSNTGRTQAQISAVGADQIWRLLQTLDTLRAQRMETRALIDMQKNTIAMQREVNQELREENEKLVLALELRDIELGEGASNPDTW